MAMAATADMGEVMVDTDTVDTEVMVVTVAREKLKLPQLHTMVDTEDTDMVDTEVMVDTVESVKLKLPHTTDMVVMVDTVMVDTEDTLTASKRSIIYIIPRLIATPFNLESFHKIHDNMSSCYKKQLVIMSNRQQNLKRTNVFLLKYNNDKYYLSLSMTISYCGIL